MIMHIYIMVIPNEHTNKSNYMYCIYSNRGSGLYFLCDSILFLYENYACTYIQGYISSSLLIPIIYNHNDKSCK